MKNPFLRIFDVGINGRFGGDCPPGAGETGRVVALRPTGEDRGWRPVKFAEKVIIFRFNTARTSKFRERF